MIIESRKMHSHDLSPDRFVSESDIATNIHVIHRINLLTIRVSVSGPVQGTARGQHESNCVVHLTYVTGGLNIARRHRVAAAREIDHRVLMFERLIGMSGRRTRVHTLLEFCAVMLQNWSHPKASSNVSARLLNQAPLMAHGQPSRREMGGHAILSADTAAPSSICPLWRSGGASKKSSPASQL
jgi:hypothetical protein